MGLGRKIYYYDKRAKRRNPPIRLSPGEHLGLWIFVVVAFWPFCLCIKGSTELTIALLWWGFLALLIFNQKQKEKRDKKPKRPFV